MDASDRRKRAGSEAADWFSRLQAGTMERAEREQFVEWLQESHLHVAAMLRIAQIHGSLAHFGRWARIATGPKTDADDVVQLPPLLANVPPAPAGQLQGPPLRRSRAGHSLRLLGIAATVLLIVVTAVVLPRVRGQVIQTERAERREVVLSDGSQLQVDPETLLRVKYSDARRQVFLERGRALFHVAKSPGQPFLVYADDTTVRAVGTVFGVEQRTQGVVVTVAEGKVAVSPYASSKILSPFNSVPSAAEKTKSSRAPSDGRGTRSASNAGSVRSTRDTFFLTANQQLTVADKGPPEPVRQVDSQRALAWAEGRLIFQNDEVQQAVAEFNRYNRIKLTVADSVLAAKPVSGVFNVAEPETFIAFLQSVTPLEIERDGNRSITIGGARSRAEHHD